MQGCSTVIGERIEGEVNVVKAWLVRETGEFCAAVVFAETRGKARSLAMHTEVCEDVRFCDIEVYRKPTLDKYYTDGKTELYWHNSKDRVALVKDGGFVCDRDYWEPEDCKNCPATEYCDMYEDYIREKGGE